MQGAEGKRLLRIYRGAYHRSGNRTHIEEKQNRIYFDWLISSRSRDNELAAWSKSSEKGGMDLLFAAVGRISRGGPTPLPPEGGVPFPRRNAAFRRQRLRPQP